jgi:hypothetical protein
VAAIARSDGPKVTGSKRERHRFASRLGQALLMPSAPAGAADAPVHISTVGDAAVLAVGARLDAETGAALLAAARAVATTGISRIDIDLRGLLSFTPAGAEALVACRDLAAALSEGLHYRTGQGAGRDALLAAYAP